MTGPAAGGLDKVWNVEAFSELTWKGENRLGARTIIERKTGAIRKQQVQSPLERPAAKNVSRKRGQREGIERSEMENHF